MAWRRPGSFVVGSVVISGGFALAIVPVRHGVDRRVLFSPGPDLFLQLWRDFIERHAGVAAMLANKTALQNIAGKQRQQGRPAAGGFCGGLHGHVKADLDGRIFLPKGHCGFPWLAISADGGDTWTRVQISNLIGAAGDPSVATDTGGNVYRGVRVDPNQAYANFNYYGPNKSACIVQPACYTNLYFKQNNASEDDFSDIIGVCSTLSSNTPDAAYPTEVRRVLDVENWMLYFACNTLVDNRETALSNGEGDDYAMYRSGADGRMRLMGYDTDTIVGQGDSPGSITGFMSASSAADSAQTSKRLARVKLLGLAS